MSNKLTSEILHKYCNGFKFITTNKDDLTFNGKYPWRDLIVEKNDNIDGYRITDKEILLFNNNDYAILIKLTGSITNQKRTIHILFGKEGRATTAAAYYLYKNYRTLYDLFKDKSYFIAIEGNPFDGYKSFNNPLIDLTDKILYNKNNYK